MPRSKRNRVYNERVILVAAKLYAVGIPATEIARQMNIPHPTIKNWIATLKRHGLKHVDPAKREEFSFKAIVEAVNAEIEERKGQV